MALTLGATLATAQDSMVRSPIVDLNSTQTVDAIPFDGSPYNFDSDDEQKPLMLGHSTGRMVSVFKRGDDIVFLYTDVARTFWTEEVVYTHVNGIDDIAACEMANGNIGILWSLEDKGSISRIVVTVEGVVVTAGANTITAGANITMMGLSVCKRSDDSYFFTLLTYNSSTLNYYAYFYTSSDFLSWGSETYILNGILSITFPKYYTAIIEDGAGNMMLFFDYATQVSGNDEITNIYWQKSIDDGVSWSAPEIVTSHSSWGTGAYHPSVAIDSDEDMTLGYHTESAVLTMDLTTPQWQNECSGADDDNAFGSDIFFDAARRKLNVISIVSGLGTKHICSVNIINVDNWTVERSYTTATSPAYNSAFLNENVWAWQHHSEGKYITFATGKGICVINDDDESIVHYYFQDWPEYSWTTNVDHDFPNEASFIRSEIKTVWIDESEDYMYCLFLDDYLYTPMTRVVVIDLTATADPVTGLYPVVDEYDLATDYGIMESIYTSSFDRMTYVKSMGYLLLGSSTTVAEWKGQIAVFNESNQAIVNWWSYDEDPTFPYRGVTYPIYTNGSIYAGFTYESGYGQETYRGLVQLNVATGVVTYHRPTYATINNYGLREKVLTDDGRIVIATAAYGVVVFDPTLLTWTRYDETTVPGWEPGGVDQSVASVAYDASLDRIYAGCPTLWTGSNPEKIKAFNESGDIKQGKYATGAYGADWIITPTAPLTEDTNDYEVDVAFDDEDALWANWTRKATDGELSAIWDQDLAELNLTDYIVTDSAVTAKWNITDPGSLSFTMSNGHLFDQHNSLSTIARFITKGRTIDLKFGENVSGSNYWQTQGTYYVDDVSVKYKRGAYPTIRVRCVDKRGLMEDVRIKVSEAFSNEYPESTIEDLLTTYTDIESGGISITNFDTRHTLYHQLVDEKMLDGIEDILEHFGYFMYMDADEKFKTREVRTSGSTDHTYSDTTKIVDFTPDDSFSDFTNRVIIIGESREFMEVLYAEELIKSVNGTGGWWSDKNEVKTIYFSDDKKKKIRYPRLVAIQSISDFQILWMKSQGTEYISATPLDELSIDVTIEFPGLMSALIGTIAGVVALGTAAIFCDEESYCGMMMMSFTVMTSMLSYILGQIATYEYEIYGMPVGEEFQTYAATANDLDFQEYLNGNIYTQEVEDPFCYTYAECQRVADDELALVQAQRKRVMFSKIAHLQDEIGDILTIPHPYSGSAIKVFATELTRTLKKGTVGGSPGSFTDTLNGWRL